LGGTYSNTAGANPKLKLYDTAGGIYGIGVSANQMDFMVPAAAGFDFYPNGTAPASVVISSGGNVGIGTTTPNALLDVYSGHFLASRGGSAPTISSCGGTGSAVTGTDNSFKLTTSTAGLSTGANKCLINFGTTWTTAPNACVITPANTNASDDISGWYISTLSTAQFASDSRPNLAAARGEMLFTSCACKYGQGSQRFHKG
jgi:hypothetical protein